MKNLIAVVIVLTSFVFTSCEKTELPTPTSTPANTVEKINVEYIIESESGHFTCEYKAPVGTGFETVYCEINRPTQSVSFKCFAGNLLSLKAHNSIPSGKSIKVTILVNGVLFKFGEATAPGAIAFAEGTY